MEQIGKKKCCCPCHAVVGILVIVFGLVFLLERLDVISAHLSGIVWPTVVILAGVKMVVSKLCKCCQSSDCPTTQP